MDLSICLISLLNKGSWPDPNPFEVKAKVPSDFRSALKILFPESNYYYFILIHQYLLIHTESFLPLALKIVL